MSKLRMDGFWYGLYGYGSSGRNPVVFSLCLREGWWGRFKGSVTDNPDGTDQRHGQVVGNRKADVIYFGKAYNDPYLKAISYMGYWKDGRLDGTWEVKDDSCGIWMAKGPYDGIPVNLVDKPPPLLVAALALPWPSDLSQEAITVTSEFGRRSYSDYYGAPSAIARAQALPAYRSRS